MVVSGEWQWDPWAGLFLTEECVRRERKNIFITENIPLQSIMTSSPAGHGTKGLLFSDGA